MRIALDIIAILICAVIVMAFVLYQILDKNRYLATEYLRKLDNDISEWLTYAGGLFKCGKTDEVAEQKYRRLVDQVNSVKNSRRVEKVPVLREACELFRTITYENYDNDEIERLSLHLTEMAGDMASIIGRYNYYVYRTNRLLEKRIFKYVAKVFRVRKMPILIDLTVR